MISTYTSGMFIYEWYDRVWRTAQKWFVCYTGNYMHSERYGKTSNVAQNIDKVVFMWRSTLESRLISTNIIIRNQQLLVIIAFLMKSLRYIGSITLNTLIGSHGWGKVRLLVLILLHSGLQICFLGLDTKTQVMSSIHWAIHSNKGRLMILRRGSSVHVWTVTLTTIPPWSWDMGAVREKVEFGGNRRDGWWGIKKQNSFEG